MENGTETRNDGRPTGRVSRRRRRALLSVACGVLGVVASGALADVPRTMHIQGVLTDDAGLPLTGDYGFTFSIYTDTTQAAAWSEAVPLHTERGFYDAALDVTGVDFGVPCFLGIEVDGSPLGPKKPLASVPYALAVPDKSVGLGKIDVTGAAAGEAPVFDGAGLVWQSVAGAAGDITAVTPGNGLKGGGASGDVSVWIDTAGVGTTELADGSVTAAKIPSGQVVKSLNSRTDSVRIVAGSQVSVLESGDSIIISASIAGAGADGDWTVNGDDMYAQTAGNVGIGVIAPSEKLDVSGVVRTDSQFVSTVEGGTAPFQVASSTLVSALNADLLDGEHASAFAEAVHAHDAAEITTGTVSIDRLPVGATSSTVARGDHTHAAADDGDWTVNGASVYRASGNIGVGTSTPGYTLDLQTNSAGIRLNTTDTGDPRVNFQDNGTTRFTLGVDISDGSKFKIGTGAVSTNTRFTIDGAGNVGLGTGSPSMKLHLESDAASDGILLDNVAATGDPVIQFALDGDTKFTMGVDDSEANKFIISRRHLEWDPAITIDSLGHVGIGTSAPQTALYIATAEASDGIDINNVGGDGDPRLRFLLNASAKFALGVDDGDGDKFKIGTTTPGTSTRLTIDGSGNIGIGTTSPATKLHVDGGTDLTGEGGGYLLLGDPAGTAIRMDNNEIQSYAAGIADGSTLYLQRENGSALDVGMGAFFIDDLGHIGIGTTDPGYDALTIMDPYSSAYALNIEGSATMFPGNCFRINFEDAPTSLGAAMRVNGPAETPDNFTWLSFHRALDYSFVLYGDGDVLSAGQFYGGADFAEMIRASEGASTVSAGDVVVIDPDAPRSIRKSTTARSTLVAGVYSTDPGFVGTTRDWDGVKQEEPPAGVAADGPPPFRGSYEGLTRDLDQIPLAVVGIVPCRVSAENGPIRAGDLLVTSSTPGHAMRDDDPKAGTIVGKALGDLASGTGVIDVLVTLQ